MKLSLRSSLTLCVFLAAALSASLVWSQAVRPHAGVRAGEGGGPVAKIRKLVGLNKQTWERSPEYKTNSGRGAMKQAGDWPQIVVTYETEPEWIDELVIQYFAMTCKTGEDGKKAYSLFRTSVRYVDVQKDRIHTGSAFLRPTAIKRFGNLIAIAVEISVQGKTVDEKGEDDIKMPDKWWKDPTVVDRKDVTVRDGYLMDRSLSPFALINIDDYEVAK